MRKRLLGIVLLFALIMLSGCTMLDELSQSDALPDLRLLVPPEYQEETTVETAELPQTALQLDLWLDATPVMGGINTNPNSMYPHASRKYREGGFHYRYENQTGMYETMLRCMLSAMENSRVRLLRYGNERLPDDYLKEEVSLHASKEELSSIRRDMLTYAIDPMPSVFDSFSAEKMTDSFYSTGTPKMNQLANTDARILENTGLADRMEAALVQQISAIAKGNGEAFLPADDTDSALLYALNNLDLNRLSVITCDPAAIRRLNAVSSDGQPRALVEEILRSAGVFDAGMSVGLYAFTLDYMGQMASFTSADFSEPLIWGRLAFNNRTGLSEGTLVMPRTLLTLVIGQPAQVETFTTAFEKELAASATLQVPRGPQKGELTYTRNGETVVQEPFGFDYEYMVIARPQVEPITQRTEGIALAADDALVTLNGLLNTVTLAPVDGMQPDRTLTLTLPLAAPSGNITLDAGALVNVRLKVESALLMSDIIANGPDAVIPEGAQGIPLRDKIYLFSQQEAESPVRCADLASNGQQLTVQLAVDGRALKPGYYRIVFSADLPGSSLAWSTPAWVDVLNINVTNEQITEWESFTKLLTKYGRKRNYIANAYHHAWGDASNTAYYGEPVPDFPAVMMAPGLSELVHQLQSAAHPQTTPYIHYVFDLFVPNQP